MPRIRRIQSPFLATGRWVHEVGDGLANGRSASRVGTEFQLSWIVGMSRS